MPQMQEPSALGRIVELVRDLRRRCPWDAAQTRATLRPYLVEEVLELDHALAEEDGDGIRVELGDLLLHLAFQIVLAEEHGAFGAEDLTRTVEEKMWRRHPHLFGGGQKAQSWEQQKLREREATDRSVLDGLPRTLPPILMAFRLQERAAGVGFDWPDVQGPREKMDEELRELDDELAGETVPERLEHEIGDLLFTVVNLARKLNVDPRAALEGANRRFRRRFGDVERLAADRGVDLAHSTLEDLDRLWDEVKHSADR